MEKKTMTLLSVVLTIVLVAVGVLFVMEKNAHSTDLSDWNDDVASLNSEIENKDAQISALNEEATGKDTQIAERDSQIADLSAQLEEMYAAHPVVNIPDSVPGAFSTTRSFLYALEQKNIIYTYNGLDRDGDDAIVIYDNCAGHSITIRVWFMDSLETASIRIWDVITFNGYQKATVTDVCNQLNNSYRYVTFSTENDNTVTLSYDAIFRDNSDAGDIVLEGLLRCINILSDCYPSLEPYNH